MARKPATVITITSRLAMWESSWASTPSSSRGSRLCMMPVVTQTVAVLRAVAGGERVRDVGVGDGDPRLGQVGQLAEALDQRVQLGRLVAAR